MIAAQEQRIAFAEPLLELHEAATVFARFAFGDERRFLLAERINVEVVAAAAKPTGTAQRVALAVEPESAVSLDKLALDPVALPAMSCAAAATSSLRCDGGSVIGGDRSPNFILTPGLQAATCEARFSVGHALAACDLPVRALYQAAEWLTL